MKKRILSSICLFSIVSVLLSSTLLLWASWQQFTHSIQQEVRAESAFVKAGVEVGGLDYIISLKGFDNRVTLIDTDGTVLYDTTADQTAMENHKDRPEVAAALAYGSGEDLRSSATLSERTFYRAIRLSNGQVIRLAANTRSALSAIVALIPIIIGIVALMGIGAMILARRQTNRIVAPINDLDLEHPTDCYDELAPLVRRINGQTEKIHQQMMALDANHRKGERLRREFTANVSHELKTPLQTISGSAEIMRNGLVPPADQPQFIDSIFRESQRLISLVDDIMRLSRLDEGTALKLEPVELLSLSQEIIDRLTPAANQGWITLKATGQVVSLVSDRRIWEEILFNLVENGIKYNKPGGSVTIATAPQQVTITDTGMGIPQEHLERVFERFYRVDTSHSKTIGGTGLGMSIVKHGAAAVGATLHLESREGAGTTVTIDLPLQQSLTEA